MKRHLRAVGVAHCQWRKWIENRTGDFIPWAACDPFWQKGIQYMTRKGFGSGLSEFWLRSGSDAIWSHA